MLNVILLPLLAVVGGVGGFFLRRWELTTAFESTGLAIPGASVSIALIVLSVLVVLALALLCRRPANTLNDYAGAFSAQGNWPYLIVMALAAACILVAGLFGLRNELGWLAPRVLQMLLWIMCLLSFVCVVITALQNFRAQGRKYSLALLPPGYTLCIWLVLTYKDYNSEPVLLVYVYELFAIICTMLGIYFAAAFSFGRGRARRCAFFSLAGIYFSIITLADSRDLTVRLLLLFSILYLLSTVVPLLHHAYCAHSGQSPDQLNSNQEVTPDE